MRMQNKQSGFTFVEMIVVIIIFAIIGGISSVIIGRSLDSYAALDRREKIQTSLRLVIERMSRELRNALPYSFCVYTGSACSSNPDNKVYFIPIKSSARYQNQANQAREELRVNNNNQNDRFHVLSTNATVHLDANVGDWIVVNSLNNVDVYAAYTNQFRNIRHKIGSVGPDVYSLGGTNYYSDLIIYNGGNKRFESHSPTYRFSVIDDTKQVTLFYTDGSNLYRDTTSFEFPFTPTGNQRLLMENVTDCRFTYIASTLSKPAVLRIDLTVEIQGEKVQVIHEAQVHNVP
jgi:MSHA biogenesis protein MshO